MGPVIETDRLTHEYPDGTIAIRNITLTIDQGEHIAVIGANGSGKSTLQLALGGLIDTSTGRIEYFEETTDVEAIRDRLGVLLQDPDDYLFNTTVREDLEYGPSQFGMSQQTAAQRIEQFATQLGLTDLLDQPPFRLSGGEKQRAAVASALTFDPDVLLFDEPFGAVDNRYRERIFELMTGHEGTVILFTPSPDVVPEMADRVILIGQNGSVVSDGPVREILTDRSLLTEHGLQPPATVRLFEEILDTDEIPLTVSEARQFLSRKIQ